MASEALAEPLHAATPEAAPSKVKAHPPKIPCLDGLRAISILLVVLSHAEGTTNFPNIGLKSVLDFGHFGVRVFFLISGYLITRLLLEEHAKTKTISLFQFYFRRTFRIFPPLYVLIGAVWVMTIVGGWALKPYDIAHALTYTMNYHNDPNRSWELGHLWSLAVEEQFYFIWPAVVLLLKPKNASAAAIFAVVACPIVRIVTMKFMPASKEGIDETFQTVADTLATGCLLALLRPRLDAWKPFVRFQSFALAPIVCFALAMGVYHFQPHVMFSLSIGETLTNVFLALTIDACLRNPTSAVGKALEWRPIAFIGVLSYSIYLVQQLFMNRERPDAWYTQFPANFGLVFGAAILMHYLIEKPSLKARAWIQTRFFAPRK